MTTDDLRTTAVSGVSLPAGGFRLCQSDFVPDVARVLDVLNGDLAAYRVRDFVTEPDCRAITANFWASTGRYPRYGEGADGVEAYLVGASHIDKTTADYLDSAEKAATAIRELFARTDDPVSRFLGLLTAAGAVPGARAAAHRGRTAAASKAVCWNNIGEYRLLPHDDLAQLSDPLQAGFEIQRIRRVMAVNVYPHVPVSGGAIRIWNVVPDAITRDRLGVTHSGYPYPPASLTDHPVLDVPVASGDLCVINGNLVHGVLGGDENDRARLLLTCFTGLAETGELLWWT